MTDQKKTLVEKLAEACEACKGVEKTGYNEAQRYKYVKAADVAKEIRHELFQRGIVVIPSEEELVSQQLTFTNAKGESRTVNEVRLKTAYHITDGTQDLVMNGYGIAFDSGDKAIYKAKTGSLKYFLRGLGLIPDEKDDPEADESVDHVTSEAEGRFQERTGQSKAAPALVNGFLAMFEKCGKTQLQLDTMLKTRYSAKTAFDVTRAELDELIKWAAGKEALQETLNTSVEAATKPQERQLDTSVSQSTRKPGNGPTEPQLKRLYAISKAHNVSEADIKQFIKENYGVESTKELSRDQYNGCCNWMEQQTA